MEKLEILKFEIEAFRRMLAGMSKCSAENVKEVPAGTLRDYFKGQNAAYNAVKNHFEDVVAAFEACTKEE